MDNQQAQKHSKNNFYDQVADGSALSGNDGEVCLPVSGQTKILKSSDEWLRQEVDCARALSFLSAADVSTSIKVLKKQLKLTLQTEKIVILIFDQEKKSYFLIEQWVADIEKNAVRIEEPLVSIASLLQIPLERAAQYPLMLDNSLVGFVGVALPVGNLQGQYHVLLKLLAPYLTVKVKELLCMTEQESQQKIQDILFSLSKKLVQAVDPDSILASTMACFLENLQFEIGAYFEWHAELQSFSSKKVFQQDLVTGRLVEQDALISEGHHEDPHNIMKLLNSLPSGDIAFFQRASYYTQLLPGIHLEAELIIPIYSTSTTRILLGVFILGSQLRWKDSLHKREKKIAYEAASIASSALERSYILEKALELASCDELTGLITRRVYYQRFESELERARRQQTFLCVALIDVDHFKQFNDSYGHLSGDLVLKVLARRLTHITRKSDVVCRFGGEEFALLLPDTGLSDATELMERIRESVASMSIHGVHGEQLSVTISIGLVQVKTSPNSRPHASDISEALAQADIQLYQAKNRGRNRVCVLSTVSDLNANF